MSTRHGFVSVPACFGVWDEEPLKVVFDWLKGCWDKDNQVGQGFVVLLVGDLRVFSRREISKIAMLTTETSGSSSLTQDILSILNSKKLANFGLRWKQSTLGLRHHELGNTCSLALQTYQVCGRKTGCLDSIACSPPYRIQAWESQWAQRVGMHWWVFWQQKNGSCEACWTIWKSLFHAVLFFCWCQSCQGLSCQGDYEVHQDGVSPHHRPGWFKCWEWFFGCIFLCQAVPMVSTNGWASGSLKWDNCRRGIESWRKLEIHETS